MNATLTIDKAGRVVIPKAVRDEMRLDPGDSLEVEANGDTITLRPVRSATRLRKERGIWVYRDGKPMTLEDTNRVLQDIRDERDRHNLGNYK
jgi:AbrB family looped-hinge helix DNA binding protein